MGQLEKCFAKVQHIIPFVCPEVHLFYPLPTVLCKMQSLPPHPCFSYSLKRHNISTTASLPLTIPLQHVLNSSQIISLRGCYSQKKKTTKQTYPSNLLKRPRLLLAFPLQRRPSRQPSPDKGLLLFTYKYMLHTRTYQVALLYLLPGLKISGTGDSEKYTDRMWSNMQNYPTLHRSDRI